MLIQQLVLFLIKSHPCSSEQSIRLIHIHVYTTQHERSLNQASIMIQLCQLVIKMAFFLAGDVMFTINVFPCTRWNSWQCHPCTGTSLAMLWKMNFSRLFGDSFALSMHGWHITFTMPWQHNPHKQNNTHLYSRAWSHSILRFTGWTMLMPNWCTMYKCWKHTTQLIAV